MYAVLGFFTGIVISILAGRNDEFNTAGIYQVTALVLLFIAIILIFVSVYLHRQLNTVSKDYTKYMDMDSYDIYRYNKFNDLQVVDVLMIVLSIISVSIFIILESNFLLFLLAAAVFLVALWLSFTHIGLVRSLYPERNLPKPGDRKYAEKLLAASDEGERHVMLNGLYKTYQLIQSGLMFGIVLLIFYSVLTGESQIFAIIVIGVLLIVAHLKYSMEIRER
jgi:ABC-type multidrug transport system fused ATPase/permease subunit